MKEIEWRAINGAPGYEVSSVGQVATWKPRNRMAKQPTERRLLKPSPAGGALGYLRVGLTVGGVKKDFSVHRLVTECFHGSPEAGQVVRHLDGNKLNNCADNLTWGTQKENIQDSRDHGTWYHGERVHTSRLTERDVLEIRNSSATNAELAERFGVGADSIWNARTGRTWKHLKL